VHEVDFNPFILDYSKVNELKIHPEFAEGKNIVEEMKLNYFDTFHEGDIPNPFDQFYIKIKSNAFLWH
jgi:hypothetical protein